MVRKLMYGVQVYLDCSLNHPVSLKPQKMILDHRQTLISDRTEGANLISSIFQMKYNRKRCFHLNLKQLLPDLNSIAHRITSSEKKHSTGIDLCDNG